MDIGVGLPVASPGVSGEEIIKWAQSAESYGFATVSAIDRLVYDCYEPLITLAAVAAETERIELMTSVLISPLWSNAALLAKQAATLDRIAGGRFTLGLGVGWRPDDFETSGVDRSSRGKLMDEQLETMRAVWAGDAFGHAGRIGPAPGSTTGPSLLFGGGALATIRRIVEHGDGWIGVGDPERFSTFRAQVERAWEKQDRAGKPRGIDSYYFGLDSGGREIADDFLLDFYDIAPGVARWFAGNALVTESDIQERVAVYEELQADELLFIPCSHDPSQLEMLARIVLD